jgi:hypothetical protein
MSRRRSKAITIVAAVLLGAPLAFVAVFVLPILYDRHRIYSMCERLVPGTSMRDVRKIVVEAGVGQLLPSESRPNPNGSYSAKEANWFFAIPVAMEYGDERCGIYNDGHVVIRAAMESL